MSRSRALSDRRLRWLFAPHFSFIRTTPRHSLEIVSSGDAPVEMIVDGRPVGQVEHHIPVIVRYQPSVAQLARLPDGGFFSRFNERFGAHA